MKFYDCATAPSPRRVRIFLAEKGITVPAVQVNLREGEHLQPAFRKINPEATVPALELDNGTVITDAIAICVYFEETHPDPPLIGRTPEEKAVTIAWNRRVERDGFYAVMEAFRNSTPGLKGRAFPAPTTTSRSPRSPSEGARVVPFFAWMNAHLEKREFVAGPRYSMADITAQITSSLRSGRSADPGESCPHLARWFAAVSARPSAKA